MLIASPLARLSIENADYYLLVFIRVVLKKPQTKQA